MSVSRRTVSPGSTPLDLHEPFDAPGWHEFTEWPGRHLHWWRERWWRKKLVDSNGEVWAMVNERPSLHPAPIEMGELTYRLALMEQPKFVPHNLSVHEGTAELTRDLIDLDSGKSVLCVVGEHRFYGGGARAYTADGKSFSFKTADRNPRRAVMTCIDQDGGPVFHLRWRHRGHARRLKDVDVALEPEWEQTEALVGLIVHASIAVFPEHVSQPMAAGVGGGG